MSPTPARETFAHDAGLTMAADADERAPGAAITVALCGSMTHEPPCPLAPHHTHAERTGGDVVLRVLFATAPQDEPRVRRLLAGALAAGSFEGPDGTRTSWRLIRSAASAVREDERDHAERLTRS